MSLRQGNSVIAGGIQIDNTPTSGSSNAVSSDGVYTALGGKADIDASNFDATGKSTIAGFPMPSSTYDELTLGTSGTEYIAPANGWVQFTKYVNGTQYVSMGNETRGMGIRCVSGATDASVFLPVSKGDHFTTWYNASGATRIFKFIYANGSENEAN